MWLTTIEKRKFFIVRAVLFDLDETLFDRTGSLRQFLKVQHRRVSDLRDVPLDMFVEAFLAMDKRGMIPKSKVYPDLLAQFGLLDDALGQDLLEEYNCDFRKYAQPHPGLDVLLQGLADRALPAGIVTNGHIVGQTATVKALGLEASFEVVLISESEGIRKPEPEIFFRAAKKLNTHPTDCVFVGDTPSADIVGAQNAGMQTIWFPNGNAWPDSSMPRADAEITSLPEVLKVVDQWRDWQR